MNLALHTVEDSKGEVNGESVARSPSPSTGTGSGCHSPFSHSSSAAIQAFAELDIDQSSNNTKQQQQQPSSLSGLFHDESDDPLLLDLDPFRIDFGGGGVEGEAGEGHEGDNKNNSDLFFSDEELLAVLNHLNLSSPEVPKNQIPEGQEEQAAASKGTTSTPDTTSGSNHNDNNYDNDPYLLHPIQQQDNNNNNYRDNDTSSNNDSHDDDNNDNESHNSSRQNLRQLSPSSYNNTSVPPLLWFDIATTTATTTTTTNSSTAQKNTSTSTQEFFIHPEQQDDDSNNNNQDDDDNNDIELLPEIETFSSCMDEEEDEDELIEADILLLDTSNEDDVLLTLPLEELDRIFDIDFDFENNNNNNTDEQQQQQQAYYNIDNSGVLQLLDQLGDLTIDYKQGGDYPPENTTATTATATATGDYRIPSFRSSSGNHHSDSNSSSSSSNSMSGGGDDQQEEQDLNTNINSIHQDSIPSFWYCQPCTPLLLQEKQHGYSGYSYSNNTGIHSDFLDEDWLFSSLADSTNPAAAASTTTATATNTNTPTATTDFDDLLRLSNLTLLDPVTTSNNNNNSNNNTTMNMKNNQGMDQGDNYYDNNMNYNQHLQKIDGDGDDDESDDDDNDDEGAASADQVNFPHHQFNLSDRPEAIQAVQFLLNTFDATLYNPQDHANVNGTDDNDDDPALPPTTTTTTSKQRPPKKERLCLGHRERILGVDVSECGRFVATASQDGTVRIWNASSNALLTTLHHTHKDFECLRVAWASTTWGHGCGGLDRFTATATTSNDNNNNDTVVSWPYLLASGGADGRVQLWGCDKDPLLAAKNDWKCLQVLDHATYSHFLQAANDGNNDDRDENDKPQIYSLQFIDHWKAFTNGSHINNSNPDNDDGDNNTDDKPNSFLLTSSDDHVHLWEIDDGSSTNIASPTKKSKSDGGRPAPSSASSSKLEHPEQVVHLREVFSLRFGSMYETGYGVHLCSVTGDGILMQQQQLQHIAQNDGNRKGAAKQQQQQQTQAFGGDRNPHNLVYVFDAAYCRANGLLGVALSDGSLRLLNGRGVCLTLLHLPGQRSHLTSFGWDTNGTRLATSVATGQVITWHVQFVNHSDNHNNHNTDTVTHPPMPPSPSCSSSFGFTLQASCCAVLDGGHEHGRPVFGVAYCGLREDLLLSWGVDGRLCVWDSRSTEEIHGPLAILLDKPDYPIFAVALRPEGIVVAGGDGGDQIMSFVGIPVFLYDFDLEQNDNNNNNKHTTTPGADNHPDDDFKSTKT